MPGPHEGHLTVVGATGPTGEQVVERALAAGWEVTAVARRPDVITRTDPKLRVVEGDVLVPSSLREPVSRAQAVISALGTHGRQPTTVYSHGTQAVLEVMREVGVRRFVGLTAGTVAPKEHQSTFERFVLYPVLYRFFGVQYADMHRMERIVTASDRDWTVYRPPNLTRQASTGKYRIAVDQPLRHGWSLPRADLAAAMLDAATDPALVGHFVTIAT